VFSRKNWFKGEPVKNNGIGDIAWFLPDRGEMTEENWQHGAAKSVAIYLNGQGLHSVDSEDKKVVDDNFYIIFNAHDGAIDYKLPDEAYGKGWQFIMGTGNSSPDDKDIKKYKAQENITVEGRSVVLLQNFLKGQLLK